MTKQHELGPERLVKNIGGEIIRRGPGWLKDFEESGTAQRPIVDSDSILSALRGGNVQFPWLHVDPDQTTIRGITLREPLVIEKIDCQTDLVFVSCYFEETVYIRSGTFKKISISGGRITHPFMIYGGTFKGKFELDQVDAENMESDNFISVGFWGGEFNGDISIHKGAYHRISIATAAIKNFSINVGAYSSYNHDLKPFIKTLEISPKTVQIVEVNRVPIEQLKLAGVLETGLYYFGDLSVNRLELRYFINRGRLRFHRINTFVTGDRTDQLNEPSLVLANSDLGQARFSQMDLTRFRRVELHDCNLTQVESSESEWFTGNQLKQVSEKGKRDIYRQLKQAMISQGNRIEELHFQAREMEAYRRSLSFKHNFFDKLILCIGKYTNNFGTNYLWPVLWIFVVAAGVFLLSAFVLGVSVTRTWGSMFTVMNPAHEIDYLVPKDQLSNKFIAIDFAGRVIISILIYQLIVPFRKFASRP